MRLRVGIAALVIAAFLIAGDTLARLIAAGLIVVSLSAWALHRRWQSKSRAS